MSEKSTQRVRITFSEGEAVRYISHLDLLRAWERIIRRAGLPLAYSQGFNPHPQIVIAMPLPVGCTGGREQVDVVLDRAVPPDEWGPALAPVLPAGIAVSMVEEVPLHAPAQPSLIESAAYAFTLVGISAAEVAQRAQSFLAREAYETTFRGKSFDMRALVGALSARDKGDNVVLEAVLLRDERGRIGRPDVLLNVLGLTEYAQRLHRTRIHFRSTSTH